MKQNLKAKNVLYRISSRSMILKGISLCQVKNITKTLIQLKDYAKQVG